MTDVTEGSDSHHRQKSSDAVVRSTCRREKYACGPWKRHRRRDGNSACAPFVKKAENRIQFSISELAVQVSRSGFPCDSERKVCPGHRSCCGNCRILVPRIAVAGSENCRQDVGASKCWQGRAIENREEEKPQCSQVAEHRGSAVPPRRCGILDEGAQHERTISTFLDDFENSLYCSRGYALRFETRLRAEEIAFNRAAGAASTAEQARWAAKSARWNGLTFDTNGSHSRLRHLLRDFGERRLVVR
jgi:hypothetical protein